MKQRFWIISELFYPDETSTAYILTEIANAMASKYDVRVICGPEVYDKHKIRDPNSMVTLDSPIIVYRAEGVKLDKDKFVGKTLRFLLISSRLFHLAKKNLKTEDKVLMVTNPAPLVVLISMLKKKRGFDLNILVHDVFPENIKPAGLRVPNTFYNLLQRIFDKAYSRADMLIALGRDMKTVLENKVVRYSQNIKVEVIENWVDVDAIKMLDRNETYLKMPKNKIVIEYAGNIGRVQGLYFLLNIFKDIHNKELEFSFWGTGAEESNLKQFVAKNNLINVKFNGSYFRSQQNVVLNSCDLAVVSLAVGMFGLAVPSKTYNILASGRPILFIGNLNCEIALLIKENNIGFCFDSFDKEGIANFFESLTLDQLTMLRTIGSFARSLAENVYSKQIILNKFVSKI